MAAPADLAGILRAAAQSNPRLAAARHRWLAARERPTIARSLPDPLLTYTDFTTPIETRVGPQDRAVQITQKIPFPSKLRIAGRMAEERARIDELTYHIALRDVVADVKVSYVELVYLRRALHIIKQNQALARQLSEKAAATYAGAEDGAPDAVTLFDTLKAESQVAQLQYDAVTVAELLRAEEVRLNSLLSRPPESVIGPLSGMGFRPLQVPVEELYHLAAERRQEIQSATHAVRAAGHAARLAALSRVPDFTFGVKHSFIGSAISPTPGGGDDATALMIGFNLPIWESKNRARIAEAAQLRRAAQFKRRTELDEVTGRIAKTYFRLENAGRLARLYRESLIPQAERAMEIAEQWRDTGRDTFGRLLEAQSVWLNFQLAYQRALADYEQMVARLEQLVGISLGTLREGGQ